MSKLPDFETATETGEIVEKGGYHQPTARYQTCGCDLTTPKGAHRDVIVDLADGRRVHYYHQTPVAVIEDGRVIANHGGWKTKTTKERITDALPRGYRVQGRYETRSWESGPWYVKTPDGDEIAFDGRTAVIETA